MPVYAEQRVAQGQVATLHPQVLASSFANRRGMRLRIAGVVGLHVMGFA